MAWKSGGEPLNLQHIPASDVIILHVYLYMAPANGIHEPRALSLHFHKSALMQKDGGTATFGMPFCHNMLIFITLACYSIGDVFQKSSGCHSGASQESSGDVDLCHRECTACFLFHEQENATRTLQMGPRTAFL